MSGGRQTVFDDRRSSAVVGLGALGCAVVAAAATIAPLYTVLGAFAIALVVLAVGNLTYAVAVFTLVTFFERLPGIPGAALAKPFGLILLVSWLLALAKARDDMPFMPRDRPALSFAIVSFVGWAAVSAAWAADPAVTVANAVRLALIAVLVFAIFSAIRTPRDLRIIASSLLVGAALVSVVSLASGSNKAGRLSLGELDPNFLAASLAAALMLALFLACGARTIRVRLVLIAAVGLFAASIVMTESRGGLVALAVGFLSAIVLGGPVRAQLVATVAVVVALGIGYYAFVAPSDVTARATSTVGDRRDPRLDSWAIARRIAADHPVGGVGLGNFTVVETRYLSGQLDLAQARKLHNIPLVAHNTYLELLSEIGAIGLAIFASIAVLTVAPALRAVRSIDALSLSTGVLVRGMIVALVTLMTAYTLLSATYAKHLWLMLGIVAAIPNVARSLAERRASG